MIEAWKRQFCLKELTLDHDNPLIFVTSQWQKDPKPSIVYLFYRWVVASIFFVTFVIGVIDLKHPGSSASFKAKWGIYLTNWGYTVCTLQAVVSAVMLSICVLAPRLRSKPNLQTSALKYYKLYWVSNVIATDIAFGVTVIYWSLIYDERYMDLDALNLMVHANNSLMMLIDLFIVAHPMRLLHCCYPVVFGLCYTVLTVICQTAGVTSRENKVYIYSILDWRKPGKAILVTIAVCAFVIIIHSITWGLYKFRSWIHSRCFAKDKRDDFDLNAKKPLKIADENLASDIV